MGKKTKCCKKDSSSFSCDSSSYSSSCCLSSSTYGYCCPKYPKCYCVKDKCAPIYYPNNCVGQYPCNPCKPPCLPLCPPYPCPPSQCSPLYTSYPSVIPSSSLPFNILSNYTLFIVEPTESLGILNLPAISSLGNCNFNKMFVISNIGSENLILNPASSTTDKINGLTTINIEPNTTVNIYSSKINNTGYWCLV